MACPQCERVGAVDLNRRGFIEQMSLGTASALAVAVTPQIARAAPAGSQTREPKPAEELIRELYAGMNGWQRENLVYPWDHRGGGDRGGRFARVDRRALTRTIHLQLSLRQGDRRVVHEGATRADRKDHVQHVVR